MRASVVRENDRYMMWYSRRDAMGYRNDRGHSYRIGYAESQDGLRWKRLDDQAGINISSTGWDSEMIAYPNVVQTETRSFLFYNGNGFGRSGIGAAQRHRV